MDQKDIAIEMAKILQEEICKENIVESTTPPQNLDDEILAIFRKIVANSSK